MKDRFKKKNGGESFQSHICPLGGDIRNNCADCIYSIDFYYDYEERDCLRRKDTIDDEGRCK